MPIPPEVFRLEKSVDSIAIVILPNGARIVYIPSGQELTPAATGADHWAGPDELLGKARVYGTSNGQLDQKQQEHWGGPDKLL